MSQTTTQKPLVTPVVIKEEVNVTRKKGLREYLEERKTLTEKITAGAAAERRRKAMDEEFIRPLLTGSLRYLVVNAQRVLSRSAQPIVRESIDVAALKAAFPEAYEATVKRTEYYRLTGLV